MVTPDHETCNWCRYKHECDHRVPYPSDSYVYLALKQGESKEEYRPSVRLETKEKHMNTYTITATATYEHTYTVEAPDEDSAINSVEWGEVDWDDAEFNGELDNVTVTDVEYGEVQRYATLDVTFDVRGLVDESDIRDALYQLLTPCDGRTTQYGDAELEIVGFSIDSVAPVEA